MMSGGASFAAPPGNFEIVPKKLVQKLIASSSAEGHPAALLRDGRAGTAWMSKPGEGVGATIAFTYSTPRHIAWITLFPGQGADSERFSASGRPAVVTAMWEGGEQQFTVLVSRSSFTRSWTMNSRCTT